MARAQHPCPGGCGQLVANDLFACRDCWYRLPLELRLAINETHRRLGHTPGAHRAALADAVAWYREQVDQR